MKILTKGSPEAREHMARLRAMRGKRNPTFISRDRTRTFKDKTVAVPIDGKHDLNLLYQPLEGGTWREVGRVSGAIIGDYEKRQGNPLTRSEAKGILASSRSAYEQSQRWAKTGPAGQNRKLLLGWAHGHATALHQYGKSRHDRMAAGELMLREDNPGYLSMPERVRQTHGEVCACGHLRAIHKDTVQGLAIGHGACTARACPCKKYTWTPQRAAFLNPCRGANPFVCPVCGGELVHMGNLGSLAYYRCRQCGMETSRPHRQENPPMLILGNPGTRRKKMRGRFHPGAHWNRRDFVRYLRETLIPDLHDMKMHNTAYDFEIAVKFLVRPKVESVVVRGDLWNREEFAIYLDGTLIPDLISMGHQNTAEDFLTVLEFLRRDGWSGWLNPSRYKRQRLEDPRKFSKGSLRTIGARGRKGVKIVIGCPRTPFRVGGRSNWDSKRKTCRVGTRAQSIMRSKNPCPRRDNPGNLPPEIADDPRFKKELAAYRKRHGNGPVRITKINVPKGYPKFMSSWGKAPHVVYDAPGHSNKGKRIHKFGERGGKQPHLVSSAERGKKFLAYAGGTFDAGGEWIHR